MTYSQLLNHLSSLTAEQLQQTATIRIRDLDEYFGIEAIAKTDESCDVLDIGHIVLDI